MVADTRWPKACPHERHIWECPLYAAAHDGKLSRLSCIRDIEPDGGCEVERGHVEYTEAVAKLGAIDPLLVAQCEWEAMKRDRNLRLNAIH